MRDTSLIRCSVASVSSVVERHARDVCECRIVEVKAYSHQGFPLSYELTTDTGLPSNEFAIDATTGVVDLLRPLDYEQDPHQYHLRVKVVENGRPPRSSMVNVCNTHCTICVIEEGSK